MAEHFFRAAANLGADSTPILTVASGEKMILTGVHASAKNAVNAEVSLEANIGTTTYTLARNVLVHHNEPLGLLTGRLVLVEGDSLSGRATASVDVWVSGVVVT